MYWYKNIRVKLNERVIVFEESLPVLALGPGKHRVWGWKLTEQRFCTDALLFDALPEVRNLMPKDWYREVVVSEQERVILCRDGRPQKYLRSGTYRYFTTDPSVTLRRFALSEPMPELTEDLIALIPSTDYVRQVIAQHQRGLYFLRGALERELSPGLYCFWASPEAPVTVTAVDLRSQQVSLSGQELMTRDKVTLRLTLTAEWSVKDATLVATGTVDARDSLYLMIQLAARDYTAGVSLDELLEGRDSMARFLESQVVPKALSIGLNVERIGVKDVVLPGEMKTILNRVIEAEKAAAANVISRREEAAATRLMANTAKLMSEQPSLMRLKELETMVSMAAQIDELRVVLGANCLEGLMSNQLLSQAQLRPDERT